MTPPRDLSDAQEDANAPHGWLCGYRGARLRPATASEAGRSRRSAVVDRHRRLIRQLGAPNPGSEEAIAYVSSFATLAAELRGRVIQP